MFNGFGERLRLALKNANYTQVRAAHKLEISKGAMLNYVKGRIPEAEILYRISKLLGTSMEWLLCGKESTQILTSEEEALINTYKQLNEQQKLKVIGYLDGLIE